MIYGVYSIKKEKNLKKVISDFNIYCRIFRIASGTIKASFWRYFFKITCQVKLKYYLGFNNQVNNLLNKVYEKQRKLAIQSLLKIFP